jgi:hypothetical protein
MVKIEPIVRPRGFYEKKRSLVGRLIEGFLKKFARFTSSVAFQTAGALPFQGIDMGQVVEYFFFKLTLTGTYKAFANGGETLSFAGIDQIKSSGPPINVSIFSQNPNGNSGWWYNFVPGTTNANGQLQIFGGASGGGLSHQELTNNTAYNSTSPRIDTDVIVGVACFVKQV